MSTNNISLISDIPKFQEYRMNLRDMIQNRDGRMIVAIGVGSGAEARQLHHTIVELYDKKVVPDFIGGFVTYVSGYLTAATAGLPDLGYILRSEIVRQTDIVEQASWMAALDTNRPAFPIGVDIDTGFGNEPSAVLLTCHQVHKQGGQYVQIEDQFGINKSCGHMSGATGTGKAVVSAEEMINRRLRPAVEYAAQQDDFSIMARTDTIGTHGFEEAMRRGHLYVDAGADMLFVEAPQTIDQLTRIIQEFADSPALTVANMIEGSPQTPYLSPRELHNLGSPMSLYCIGSLLSARITQANYYEAIITSKDLLEVNGAASSSWFSGFNRVIGREQTEHWNQFFLGPKRVTVSGMEL